MGPRSWVPHGKGLFWERTYVCTLSLARGDILDILTLFARRQHVLVGGR